ncbi:MAG: sterol desaturase family protein [Bdellovibrionota bacterium]
METKEQWKTVAATWIEILLRLAGNTFLVYFPFLVLEGFFPNHRNSPPSRYWWLQVGFLFALRTATLFLLIVTFSNYAFFSKWDFPYLQTLRVFWRSLPLTLSFTAALLMYTFVQYWTHVIRHRSESLWRWCHHLHHSPTRFNVFLSCYVHPTDILFTNGTICLAMLFSGFSFQAYKILCLFHIFCDASEHVNIKTPKWLGYILFRPEQHGLHHSAHDFNFGIITLWDLVFRTFRNPTDQQTEFGFSEDADRRFWDIFWSKPVPASEKRSVFGAIF